MHKVRFRFLTLGGFVPKIAVGLTKTEPASSLIVKLMGRSIITPSDFVMSISPKSRVTRTLF